MGCLTNEFLNIQEIIKTKNYAISADPSAIYRLCVCIQWLASF